MATGLEKARGLGARRTPEARVAAHYGISESEARRWLTIHPESELLPERGAGLTTGRAAGSIGNEIPQVSSCWPFLLVGGFFGVILGVGFAVVLSKGQ